MCNSCSNVEFKNPIIKIFSNVTAQPTNNASEIKNLLIKQIESPVRWREIVTNMINLKVEKFVEIGPGKVLSGLVKRINKDVEGSSINNEDDIKSIKI